MPRLQIDAIKISIHTKDDIFGTQVNLSDGLNIVRAKNSTGKSTLLNSILYGLGVEELLGGKSGHLMKPVLKDELEYQGEIIKVLESYVQLQISNLNNETVTITRWVKSSSMDDKLVRVHYGPLLTTNNTFPTKDFYVHMPGAAVEGAGFHHYLENFIGWDLPAVPTFEGRERKLYLQTLFPWLFVEQVKGWTGLYVPPTTNYGIRDLIKKTIEFLLRLDVINSSKIKDELNVRKSVISHDWASVLTSLREVANTINGMVGNISQLPSLEAAPTVLIHGSAQSLIDIGVRKSELDETIASWKVKAKPIQDVIDNHESRLKELEFEVLMLQEKATTLRRDIRVEQANKEAIFENIQKLTYDLQKNKDARRLYSLGSEMSSPTATGICPTCLQQIRDSLLPQDVPVETMTLDENITYIEQQLSALQYGSTQSEQVIETTRRELYAVEYELKQARQKLRVLRSELSENPKVISQSEIDDMVQTKMELARLEDASQKIDQYVKTIDELKNRWRDYLADKESVPSEFFTLNDKNKLMSLEEKFKKYLQTFGFSSIQIDDITISLDKYLPVINGFDIKVDSSASDHVRLIWAFRCALAGVSNQFGGNYPHLMILDEPGQHQMDNDSQTQLFQALSGMGGQSIVGSSLSIHILDEILRTFPNEESKVKIIDLGDVHIMKPFNQH